MISVSTPSAVAEMVHELLSDVSTEELGAVRSDGQIQPVQRVNVPFEAKTVRTVAMLINKEAGWLSAELLTSVEALKELTACCDFLMLCPSSRAALSARCGLLVLSAGPQTAATGGHGGGEKANTSNLYHKCAHVDEHISLPYQLRHRLA